MPSPNSWTPGNQLAPPPVEHRGHHVASQRLDPPIPGLHHHHSKATHGSHPKGKVTCEARECANRPTPHLEKRRGSGLRRGDGRGSVGRCVPKALELLHLDGPHPAAAELAESVEDLIPVGILDQADGGVWYLLITHMPQECIAIEEIETPERGRDGQNACVIDHVVKPCGHVDDREGAHDLR